MPIYKRVLHEHKTNEPPFEQQLLTSLIFFVWHNKRYTVQQNNIDLLKLLFLREGGCNIDFSNFDQVEGFLYSSMIRGRKEDFAEIEKPRYYLSFLEGLRRAPGRLKRKLT